MMREERRIGSWAAMRCILATATMLCMPFCSTAVDAANAGTLQSPVRVTGRGAAATVVLAPGLQRALRRHFAGYAVPTSSDYAPGLIASLPGAGQRPSVPFACWGDFDGNKRTDVALLLKKQPDRWLVVAFHQTSQGVFQPYQLDRSRGRQLRSFIERRPPGTVTFFVSGSDDVHVDAVDLQHDSISWAHPPGETEVFYFKGRKYRSVIPGG
jgi:hypothetical protein